MRRRRVFAANASCEDLVNARIGSAQSAWNIFELTAGRGVLDTLRPVDSKCRINRGGDVFHHDGALPTPTGIDNGLSDGIRRPNDLSAPDTAAHHHDAHRIPMMVASGSNVQRAGR